MTFLGGRLPISVLALCAIFLFSAVAPSFGERPGEAQPTITVTSDPALSRDEEILCVRNAIEDQLRSHGSWQQWAERAEAQYQNIDRLLNNYTNPSSMPSGLIGQDGFLFTRASILYSATRPWETFEGKKLEQEEPFATIVSAQRQLRAQNIDLVFVAVPARPEMYSHKLDIAAKKVDVQSPVTSYYLYQLSKLGVEVVDLVSPYHDATRTQKEPVYHSQDTHWSNHGIQIVVHELARRLGRYGPGDSSEILSSQWVNSAPRIGDIGRGIKQASPVLPGPAEKWLRVLSASGKPYRDSKESRFLVVGDSLVGHGWVPGSHVVAQLAYQLQQPVSMAYRPAAGPQLGSILRAKKNPPLQSRRVVVWILSARFLMQTGDWRDTPLFPNSAKLDGNLEEPH